MVIINYYSLNMYEETKTVEAELVIVIINSVVTRAVRLTLKISWHCYFLDFRF